MSSTISSTGATQKQEFLSRLKRIDELVKAIRATSNPALRAQTEELVAALLELHGVGLTRMLDIIWDEGEAGERLIHERFPQDDVVNRLLLLHDLHPLPLQDRVQQGLDKVRPYLQSHGGEVEIVGIVDGVVQLKLRGSCESCPASAMTLKYAVEDAIFDAAPDVVEVVAVSTTRPTVASLIALDQIPVKSADPTPEQTDWHRVGGLTDLKDRTILIRQVDGHSVMFCRLGEHLYAYTDRCPNCQNSLELAAIKAPALLCSHCEQSYDIVRAGRGLDKPSLHLEPLPLLVEGDHVKLALPVPM